MNGIEDQYASAVNAHSLSGRALEVLGSAGLAARKFPAGVALQRVRAAPKSDRTVAIELLSEALRRARRARKIRTEGVCEDIADAVLAWWVDPSCLACFGQAYVLTANGGRSSRPCRHCAGSGLRRLEYQSAQAAADWAYWWVLDQVSRAVEGQKRRA